jgi:hypothetical protein
LKNCVFEQFFKIPNHKFEKLKKFWLTKLVKWRESYIRPKYLVRGQFFKMAGKLIKLFLDQNIITWKGKVSRLVVKIVWRTADQSFLRFKSSFSCIKTWFVPKIELFELLLGENFWIPFIVLIGTYMFK